MCKSKQVWTYIKELIKEIGVIRFIELVWIIIWICVAIISLNQIEKQIIISNEQVKLNNEEFILSKESYVKWKRLEEVKFLYDVSEQLESWKNRIIFEKYRTKSVKELEFSEWEILDFLNAIEYIQWLREELDIKDNDIRMNFWWIIGTVCNNDYLMKTVKDNWYNGIPKLCTKWW